MLRETEGSDREWRGGKSDGRVVAGEAVAQEERSRGRKLIK